MVWYQICVHFVYYMPCLLGVLEYRYEYTCTSSLNYVHVYVHVCYTVHVYTGTRNGIAWAGLERKPVGVVWSNGRIDHVGLTDFSEYQSVRSCLYATAPLELYRYSSTRVPVVE